MTTPQITEEAFAARCDEITQKFDAVFSADLEAIEGDDATELVVVYLAVYASQIGRLIAASNDKRTLTMRSLAAVVQSVETYCKDADELRAQNPAEPEVEGAPV